MHALVGVKRVSAQMSYTCYAPKHDDEFIVIRLEPDAMLKSRLTGRRRGHSPKLEHVLKHRFWTQCSWAGTTEFGVLFERAAQGVLKLGMVKAPRGHISVARRYSFNGGGGGGVIELQRVVKKPTLYCVPDGNVDVTMYIHPDGLSFFVEAPLISTVDLDDKQFVFPALFPPGTPLSAAGRPLPERPQVEPEHVQKKKLLRASCVLRMYEVLRQEKISPDEARRLAMTLAAQVEE